jgi:hypothetical protein
MSEHTIEPENNSNLERAAANTSLITVVLNWTTGLKK